MKAAMRHHHSALVISALLVSALLAVLFTGCATTTTPTAGTAGPAATVAPAATPTVAGISTTLPAVGGLAPGVLPTDCAKVTQPEHLVALQVATTAVAFFTPVDQADPLPVNRSQAEAEDRSWPGLSCTYRSDVDDQEAVVLVMPDTSPYFTTRSTTTCEPTYGKGTSVSLGAVTGWYCPTTNETPGEWVSFAHSGRLVTVMRVSKPNGASPYKDALISYATALATVL